MIWVYGFIIAAVLVGVLADWYARRHKLGFYAEKSEKKPGRHANTGEFPTIKHDLDHELTYNTAVNIPAITAIQAQASIDYIKRAYATPVRTDTVQMEAVDPTKYPEWMELSTT